MKILILLSVIFIYGCDDMYPKETIYQGVVSPTLNLDSLFNVRDSINKVKSLVNCAYFKVKKPYYLIRWNDDTYGILWHDKYRDWYKAKNNDDYRGFSSTLEAGTHFKDSCEAKEDLKRYLDTKVTYKIVK